jgi:hypothetical protein
VALAYPSFGLHLKVRWEINSFHPCINTYNLSDKLSQWIVDRN